MSKLEQLSLLEKTHTSSGRVPSTKGFKYYNSNIVKECIDANLLIKLQEIFMDRNLALEDIFNQSFSLINEVTSLTTYIRDIDQGIKLSKIDMVLLGHHSATILLVTSNGAVVHKTINSEGKFDLEDLKVCIKIFNDRLLGCKIEDLSLRVEALAPILKKEVKNYEAITQMFVSSIFKENYRPSSSNYENALAIPEYQNIESLKQLISVVQDSNVWKQISHNKDEDETIKITFAEDLDSVSEDNITIASTQLTIPGSSKQLAIIGPKRMDYANVKGILTYLKEQIEKKFG